MAYFMRIEHSSILCQHSYSSMSISNAKMASLSPYFKIRPSTTKSSSSKGKSKSSPPLSSFLFENNFAYKIKKPANTRLKRNNTKTSDRKPAVDISDDIEDDDVVATTTTKTNPNSTNSKLDTRISHVPSDQQKKKKKDCIESVQDDNFDMSASVDLFESQEMNTQSSSFPETLPYASQDTDLNTSFLGERQNPDAPQSVLMQSTTIPPPTIINVLNGLQPRPRQAVTAFKPVNPNDFYHIPLIVPESPPPKPTKNNNLASMSGITTPVHNLSYNPSLRDYTQQNNRTFEHTCEFMDATVQQKLLTAFKDLAMKRDKHFASIQEAKQNGICVKSDQLLKLQHQALCDETESFINNFSGLIRTSLIDTVQHYTRTENNNM